MNPTFTRGVAAALIGAAAAFLLSGCAAVLLSGAFVGTTMVATDRRTSGTIVEDETIELKGASRLREALGERGSVNVVSYNRIVLLTGDVPAAADKATAEQVISRIDNVQSVVNEIAIGFNPSAVSRSKDTLLTSKVKASFVDAKDLFANSIKVVTSNRTVYLMGRVTEREANRATDVARGVDGVDKVVRVFELVSEAELANALQKPVPAAKP